MKPRWTPLALTYVALAVAGLIGTWTYNIIAFGEQRNYLGDWLGSGPSVMSLTLDILVVLIACAIFVVVEGRRIGMRWWQIIVFLVMMPAIALAFSFPLFLAFRERAKSAHTAGGMNGAIDSAS